MKVEKVEVKRINFFQKGILTAATWIDQLFEKSTHTEEVITSKGTKIKIIEIKNGGAVIIVDDLLILT